MNNLTIKLPDGIDFDDPTTITKEKIIEYYDSILIKYGNFCGDCNNFTENLNCKIGFKPREYMMEIGEYDVAYLRKKCKDFKMYKSEIDENEIKRKVGNALDCFIQQYV